MLNISNNGKLNNITKSVKLGGLSEFSGRGKETYAIIHIH